MASPGVSFIAHQGEFRAIIGDGSAPPSVFLLADTGSLGQSLYHEACIYHQPTRSVFVTSNQLPNDKDAPYPATSNKHVKLWRIYDSSSILNSDPKATQIEEVRLTGVETAMLNGGVNFDKDSLLLCAQGSKDAKDLSGIIKVPIPTEDNPTPAPETIIDSFYGIPFNSVNDVIIHPQDHSIWFTDPPYGFHQEIRPQPQLPHQVYRFDRKTGSIRAMADHFTRPNGLCFSPDLKTLYVTDTGAIHGSASVPVDLSGPSHIYAFDIFFQDGQTTEPFLTNRRLFAFAPGRFPDGIKCDTFGNVYSGCGDGIEVWNPSGVQIGTIQVPGGVANFCFGENGVIYACNETRFFKIQLPGEGVRGALLGI
ncbi:hypothetical protein V1525DRAFT_397347 [Lipomyces kononenkoae]|uniref:Uncharacterized protein n=1 Tax=Lipomyces kononenkoae TaxID=34357 RepID=A0ACC3T9Y0_LIPKO